MIAFRGFSALPDHRRPPSERLQRTDRLPIPRDIARPEVDIARRGRAPVTSLVTMPEAAMHEYRRSP
jgi:hypothetical protein